MIRQTKDAKDIFRVVEKLLPGTIGFDLEKWLHGDGTVVLTDGHDNYTLFEEEKEGIWSGHVFFTSRGRDALKVGKEMFDFFWTNYPVILLGGQTPADKPAASWFNRKMGMKSYGFRETPNGPHELFLLHRNEYEEIK